MVANFGYNNHSVFIFDCFETTSTVIKNTLIIVWVFVINSIVNIENNKVI